MKTINKTCKICGNIFTANTNRAAFCSLECKKTAKKLINKKYRESEHGAAVRRKNRKNASVIESRKRYEKRKAKAVLFNAFYNLFHVAGAAFL